MNTLFNQINPYIRYVNHLTNCNNDTHILPWRTLYDYEILFVTKGRIIVETKNEKYFVNENQFHIMSPNLEHTRYFEKDESCDYFNIHLDFFYDQYLPDFSAQRVYVDPAYILPIELTKRQTHFSPTLINRVNCSAPEKVTNLFESLFSKYKNTKIIYKQIVMKSICLKIIHEIILSCDKSDTTILGSNTFSNKYNELVNKFIDYVSNNYQLEITPYDFIKDKGLSLGHFIKIFKQEKTLTPNEYIIEYRLTLAKEFLKSGRYFVYEVAKMVGYENEFYFSRLFKKRENCSPAEYIKKFPKMKDE